MRDKNILNIDLYIGDILDFGDYRYKIGNRNSIVVKTEEISIISPICFDDIQENIDISLKYRAFSPSTRAFSPSTREGEYYQKYR